MYQTPVSNRLHIGIFGRRNTGKSSLINALTGQDLAIVSEIAGTTTDPVSKSIEILPIGPCVLIDTAGIDDTGSLGEERVRKTLKVLGKTDVGIIVVGPDGGIEADEEEIVKVFREKKLPFLFVVNKSDAGGADAAVNELQKRGFPAAAASAKTGAGIEALKKKIMEVAPQNWSPVPLVRDIVRKGDTVVLVCPIDSAMPQGRLILPEVQVLRDVLDSDAMGYVTKDTELPRVLASLKKKPDLVITDSQVFETVRDILPADVPLTSFSTIFARHKGDLGRYVEGVSAVDTLKDGDEVLIAEACTHHVQTEDIGRTKIPTWLTNRTGKNLSFEVTAGGDYPADLRRYALVVQCGGCMINRREMLARAERAAAQGVPITNYGVLIAYLSGILERIIEPFAKGVVKINVKSRSRTEASVE